MQWASEKTVHSNVNWLFHHIPKTAGTSLYWSVEEAFSREQIWRAYDDYKVGLSLTNGKPIYVPKKAKIVYGHFRPHKKHIHQFPNAKRIIWLRDPLDTAWSLLRHWLKYPEGDRCLYFLKAYVKGKSHTMEELLEFLLNDPYLHQPSRIFTSYLQGFSKEEFAFVGHIDKFEADLTRLQELLGVNLKKFQENVNKENKEFPFDRSKFEALLHTEYDLLAHWI